MDDPHGVRKDWLDAGKAIGQDKTVQVLCPECKTGFLQVKDEPIASWKKIDRYMICDRCGRHNVMTGNFPDSEFYFPED
jgi:uncharacterized protein with PIN domain